MRGANRYAHGGLGFYESGEAGDWSRLPVWNPPTAAAALDGAPVASPRPLDVLPSIFASGPPPFVDCLRLLILQSGTS